MAGRAIRRWERYRWLLVAAALWIAQLAWLSYRLGDVTWGEYWHWRGVYRPGIQAVDAADSAGGDVLPGHVFHPLSPSGAKWAFLLATGVYAIAATAAAWLACRWIPAGMTKRRRPRRIRRALA